MKVTFSTNLSNEKLKLVSENIKFLVNHGIKKMQININLCYWWQLAEIPERPAYSWVLIEWCTLTCSIHEYIKKKLTILYYTYRSYSFFRVFQFLHVFYLYILKSRRRFSKNLFEISNHCQPYELKNTTFKILNFSRAVGRGNVSSERMEV